jgi:alpha-1,2-mannosyltransferase
MEVGLTFRLPAWTIAVSLLFAALLAAVIPLSGKPSMLPIYTTAAERIVHGKQIYRPDDHEAFAYPPAMVLLAMPLLPFSPLTRARVWCFVNLCLLEAILLLIAHMLWPTIAASGSGNGPNRCGRDIPAWLLPLVVAALAGRFLISPLEYQSHDLIVFAFVMLAGCAMARQRDARAGAWAGLAAACKATPLLFLPLFCWQRRPRAAACFVAAALAATLFPPPEGRLWVAQWYDKFISKVHADAPAQAAGAWYSWNMLNQGLAATIYRLATPVESGGNVLNVCVVQLSDVVRQRLTLGLELLVIGWLAWCTWPRRRPAGLEPGLAAMSEVGMLVCAMLLLSPMSSSQHFAALLAPIAACATYWLYVRRDRFIASVLLLVFVFGALAARDLLNHVLGRYACWPLAVGCKTWIATALFVACGHILQTPVGAPADLNPEPHHRS